MSRSQRDEQERWALRKQLVQRGIALDPIAKPSKKPWPILVGLDPNPLSSRLFPIWNNCATACCIWVKFVPATRPARYIDEVSLSLPSPFGDMPFEWWPDPQDTKHKTYYEFPNDFSCPRENVANHRLKRTLQPGKPMEGFLLGVSQQRFPATLCSPVAAKLVIFDAAGQILGRKAVSLAVPVLRDETPARVERPNSLFALADEGGVTQQFGPSSVANPNA